MEYNSHSGDNTILVVDDEGFIRELFEDICADSGYGIRAAADAMEALAMLQKEDINVIFLDLKLFGMNGIELCRRIRSEKPLAIIYAMTGWAGLYEVEECREAGFDDFFRKPLSVEQIDRAIVEAFEKIRRWTRHGI
ncbi:MAG: response regulator [Syntrophales bacterium]|nr:response regulator [Syntrophales bacterium]